MSVLVAALSGVVLGAVLGAGGIWFADRRARERQRLAFMDQQRRVGLERLTPGKRR